MTDFNWYIQGGTDTEIEASDVVRFAGADFSTPIEVGEYNDTTHVKTSGGSDKSSANTPNNNKFISQAGGGGGKSQADWGDGTEDLDLITDAEAVLKIVVSDVSNFEIEQAIFFAYNGTVLTTPPVACDVRAAEVGNVNFTEAEGKSSALSLTDKSTPDTSHDYFIALSIALSSAGTLTGKFRFEGVAI